MKEDFSISPEKELYKHTGHPNLPEGFKEDDEIFMPYIPDPIVSVYEEERPTNPELEGDMS